MVSEFLSWIIHFDQLVPDVIFNSIFIVDTFFYHLEDIFIISCTVECHMLLYVPVRSEKGGSGEPRH